MKAESITSKTTKKSLFRNELLLVGELNDLKRLISKHSGNDIKTLEVVKTHQSPVTFKEVIDSATTEPFHWSEKGNILIVNSLVKFEDFNINEIFLRELSKLVLGDFKLAFVDQTNWNLVFFGRLKDKLQYYKTSVLEWEDPIYFEEEPYFVKLAKANGIKMKKNENGDKEFDSEDIYNIIYDFRDNLVTMPNTYLEIAPAWYKKMKSIKH